MRFYFQSIFRDGQIRIYDTELPPPQVQWFGHPKPVELLRWIVGLLNLLDCVRREITAAEKPGEDGFIYGRAHLSGETVKLIDQAIGAMPFEMPSEPVPPANPYAPYTLEPITLFHFTGQGVGRKEHKLDAWKLTGPGITTIKFGESGHIDLEREVKELLAVARPK